MLVYYIFIALFAILNLIDSWGIKQCQKITLVSIISFCLILFAGLRLDNADYDSYSEAYIAISQGKYILSDVGFNFILYLMNLVSHKPVIMFLGIACISVSLNLNSFKKYSPYIFTTILLYFVHNFALKEMIQIRVGLACSLCLFSLRYLIKQNNKKLLWTWLLALSIHSTVIIWGLFLSVYKLIDKRNIIFILLISIIIGYVFPLGNVIKSITNLNSYSDRLAEYVMYGNSGYASHLGVFTNINTVKSLIICVGFLLWYDRFNNKFIYFKPMFMSYCVGLCWLICFNDFSIIGARMSNILMSTEPILLTLPFSFFKRNSRIFYAFTIILFSILVFHYNIGESKIIPYNFYF